MKKTYKIYKCTNIVNNKVYIGYTKKNLKKRISEHKCFAKNNSDYLLHKAIRKYGFENFIWEVIFECFDEKYALNEAEPFFIKEFNCFYENGFGYNMTFGGQGGMTGKTHSKEARQKMKIARQKSKHQIRNPNGIGLDKAIKKAAELKKGKPTWNKGISMKKETKEKLSILYKNRTWTIDPITNKRVWI
jgi:group I intron endonuclease